MEVYIAGKRYKLNPSQVIGKGGEADVYDLGNQTALKIFKAPDHPDFQGNPHEQQAARERIAIHQEKLRAFPINLPGKVVKPHNLATDKSCQQIVGYTMKFLQGAELLLRYADKNFRQGGVSFDTVKGIFQDLHQTVAATHQAGVVIGDFNDLNVLVTGQEAHLIDADSFQFGKFYCQVFTAQFVDPLLCDPAAQQMMLFRPHTMNSDWYAYTVMLMQCLLYVDPYGGVYRPKDQTQKVPQELRPLHRITVFHPEVRYPKPAIPYKALPDDLLHYFHLVFEKDRRGEFPLDLVENLSWTTCTVCGTEHARFVCPNCSTSAPAAIKEVTVVRGNVTATRIFRTHGNIVGAAFNHGQLQWLYLENGAFKREDGLSVFGGGADPFLAFGIWGNKTLIARDRVLFTLTPGTTQPERVAVDTYGNEPQFAANSQGRFWLSSGQLYRDTAFGPEVVGEVLAGQTRFWVGSHFGFGFYAAAELSIAFVFRTDANGINDNVKLPRFRGQIVDATCTFTTDRCWFFVAENVHGKILHRAVVIRSDGSIEAAAEAEKGDGSWLSNLRGKCAAGNFLLAATDEGIVRCEVQQKQIVKTREFPDTEPFVDQNCQLFAGQDGLYVVGSNEIHRLRIEN
ncbi:MAG: hypothetical protein K1Y36_17455 [Blastocatellia bacterium]|nr:hypothetical protein [Blastocatellia bacterium]